MAVKIDYISKNTKNKENSSKTQPRQLSMKAQSQRSTQYNGQHNADISFNHYVTCNPPKNPLSRTTHTRLFGVHACTSINYVGMQFIFVLQTSCT